MVQEKEDVWRTEPVAPSLKGDLVASEVECLMHHHMLFETDEFAILRIRVDQAAHVVYEVGRLREAAFRGQGHGSGRGTDLDRFDLYYSHLVLWDKARRRIAAAARLGRSDLIASRFGTGGLRVSAFFDIREGFLERLKYPVEVDGCFVRDEYRMKTPALSLLMRGVGDILALDPPGRFVMGVLLLEPGRHCRQLSQTPPPEVIQIEGLRSHVKARCPVGRKGFSLPLRYARLGFGAVCAGIDPYNRRQQAILMVADTTLWKRSLLKRIGGETNLNRLAVAGHLELAKPQAA